jgi:DNA-binding response OmpR family regulator
MDDSERARGPFQGLGALCGTPGGAGAGSAAPRPRLLIVEDDPTTRDVLCRLFTRRGWEVLWSPSVAGGLALLHARPDRAILDLDLPDGDGARVLAAVRAAGLPVRVVVASGTVDEARLTRVALMRPDGLLQKPLDFDELIRALGDVAGRP